jgi:outer membrane protein OmpA-like peptidoglycan-associated protein
MRLKSKNKSIIRLFSKNVLTFKEEVILEDIAQMYSDDLTYSNIYNYNGGDHKSLSKLINEFDSLFDTDIDEGDPEFIKLVNNIVSIVKKNQNKK